jgi:hypothetical protein
MNGNKTVNMLACVDNRHAPSHTRHSIVVFCILVGEYACLGGPVYTMCGVQLHVLYAIEFPNKIDGLPEVRCGEMNVQLSVKVGADRTYAHICVPRRQWAIPRTCLSLAATKNRRV